ncbi:hypothetical protein GCM10010462_28610 [Microbacterium dextranolyticum]|uniref:Uncharacterized protein n=1 Tax=Microbacterium dextranolyticum TaxID=36806 RepID=A0A9W6HPK4_9MICO|nr:hypothetical protein GCM10017591_28660 [Microbacterium dextranolyticum]
MQAWEATPKAAPPRPRPIKRKPNDPLPPAPSPNGRVLDGIRVATVHPNGSIKARGCIFNVSYPMRGKDVFVVYEGLRTDALLPGYGRDHLRVRRVL